MFAYIINIFSWQFWLGVLLTILVFLWLFFGGKNHEYVGLSPLKIGIDSTKYIDPSTSNKAYKSNKRAKQYTVDPVDNTPSLPEQTDVMYLSDSICMAEEFSCEEIASPRTMALGGHKCRANTRMSNGETICKKVIEEIYGKPFYTVRPDFLKNPETGRNLELDLYNDEKKIAVEYNGKQHYVWPNNMHGAYETFIKQVRRDQFKVDMCDKNGVYLITVPYNVGLDYQKIKDYITYYLPENVQARAANQS